MRMIDRLELGAPLHVPLNSAFLNGQHQKASPAKSPYVWVIDLARDRHLRIYGGHKVPVRPERKHYKIDFVGMKGLTANDVACRLTELFLTTSDILHSFRVMRTDFAADIRGTSVEWFRQNCRVRHKRNSDAYETQHVAMQNRLETLYFGAGSDVYRIYN